MIGYFIYTTISLACAYGLYFLLLRKQKTFQFNRFFLIGSLVLCLISPLLEIEFFNSVPRITELPINTLTNASASLETIENVEFGEIEMINTSQRSPFFYVYLTISLFFVFRFLKNFFQIFKLTRHKHERLGNLKLIRSKDSKLVSSFFNYVFINENQDLHDEGFTSILKHETVHFEERHILDIIFIELLICLFWLNPIIWLYRKAILQNHEYLADDKSVSSGIDIENYSNTIINLGQKEYRIPLTSGFNFIQIKNRIIMLHQSKTSVLNRTLKIASVMLLFAGVFAFSSYKDLKEPLVVIVDAGHGGKDSGQISNNISEKDIVLTISKQLKLLSDDKVKFIMSRDSDEFSSLQERIDFINEQKPDLVLSLHCNAHSDVSRSGIEAYYYESENIERHSSSMSYSSRIASKLLELGFESSKLIPSNFKIIKESESPSVLLEIGFLTNVKDYAIVTNTKKQQEIAKTIYEALLMKE
ncbi:M56/M15 family metallopeptidase [uncultured Winogradskyella sp.]|uniref:M56/M15 family metallopeptidase n=1 Tax=uncultured Winogradskyella sp. TaxID=395353 RepID=UPI0026210D2B|nr:M56/M15 family metallopeptidase [uncultured Winogradskyella sp.]